jgi:hypothetical protein
LCNTHYIILNTFRSQNSPSRHKSLRYVIVGGYYADEEGDKIQQGDETHGNKAGNGNGPCLVGRKVVIVCIEAWWETMTMVVVLVLLANPMVEAHHQR